VIILSFHELFEMPGADAHLKVLVEELGHQ
jgi:hypothetical protein